VAPLALAETESAVRVSIVFARADCFSFAFGGAGSGGSLQILWPLAIAGACALVRQQKQLHPALSHHLFCFTAVFNLCSSFSLLHASRVLLEFPVSVLSVIVIVITNQDSTSSRLLPGSSYSCCIRNLHALVYK
jgi:hypothetical protein